ncbi:biotin--[acetyl-CoA-carboxylase] ligase [Lacticaseibacillus jixianensis]|uniref:Biotin--[acetyl-CoA-carboxylase] ligase n=1 Tax=Lacticaseibacillus jixianensis TaxID=2486012 RepID=A0ABW4B8I0_9LACO|nr:biotin--[acetyl-CoA-carboxylase] ligase [Lacticaseibacillus jixianensis]
MTFEDQLKAALPPVWQDRVTSYATIDSTNRQAARLLKTGGLLPLLLTARQQTAGVGRQGHHFSSPADTGLYWSAALTLPAQAPLCLVTPAAGVALQHATFAVWQRQTTIKWVNDLLLADRKVAGILTEVIPGPHPQLIVGIGLNLAPDPQRQVSGGQKVGALLASVPELGPRAALISTWLTTFMCLLAHPDEIMPAFRRHAAWLNVPVTISALGQRAAGVLVGFAADGAAILQTPSGPKPIQDGTMRRR